MKKILSILATVMFACIAFAGKNDRKIVVQTWSCNQMTFEELAQKLKPLGIYGVECCPINLSDKFPNVKINQNMNAQQREYLKKLLKDANLKMTGYGVTYFRDEYSLQKICDFIKEFDCDLIVTETAPNLMKMGNEIAGKNGVKIAIHHHGKKQNDYWNPEYVYPIIEEFDNVYANPDTAHSYNAGVDPIVALKKYKGKIASIHFKDLNKNNTPEILGKGKLDTKGMLAQLDAQGYNGAIVIEYEANIADKDVKFEHVKECIEFLKNN